MGTITSLRPGTRVEHPRNETHSDRHFVFSPTKITALIRSGAEGYFYDLGTPGLAIRIGKSKTVYLHAARVGGVYQRNTLGNVAGMLLADARKAVQAATGALAKGEALPPPRKARKAAREAREAERRRNGFTVDKAFNEFLAKRELRPRTRESYADVWRRVPDSVKMLPFGELDARMVADLHQKVGRAHKHTANRLVALISAICNASGRRHDNPAVDIKRYREQPRTRRLSPEEAIRLKAVLAVEREHANLGRAMLGVFCSIAYHTGARRAAVSSMSWADLDLRPGVATWLVPARWSKNGTELAVALTNTTAKILVAWRQRCPSKTWVFPSDDAEAGYLQEPKRAWKRICKAADIDGLTLHDLRRSLGSEIAAAGGNAATIAAALGHLSLQSAKAYLHLNTGEVRSALERLNRND